MCIRDRYSTNETQAQWAKTLAHQQGWQNNATGVKKAQPLYSKDNVAMAKAAQQLKFFTNRAKWLMQLLFAPAIKLYVPPPTHSVTLDQEVLSRETFTRTCRGRQDLSTNSQPHSHRMPTIHFSYRTPVSYTHLDVYKRQVWSTLIILLCTCQISNI